MPFKVVILGLLLCAGCTTAESISSKTSLVKAAVNTTSNGNATIEGAVGDFFQDILTTFCDNNTAPARALFNCLQVSTSIPQLWAGMTLNLTVIVVESARTVVSNQGNPITDDQSGGIVLKAILDELVKPFPQFCLNIDAFMKCVDPFFKTCTTSDDDGEDDDIDVDAIMAALGTAGSRSAVTTAATVGKAVNASRKAKSSASASGASGNTSNLTGGNGWKNSNFPPLISSPEQASQWLKLSLLDLCAKNGSGLSSFVQNMPCFLDAVSKTSCDTPDDMDVAGAPGDICGAMTSLGSCVMGDSVKKCQDAAFIDVMSDIGAQYINVTGCNLIATAGKPGPSELNVAKPAPPG